MCLGSPTFMFRKFGLGVSILCSPAAPAGFAYIHSATNLAEAYLYKSDLFDCLIVRSSILRYILVVRSSKCMVLQQTSHFPQILALYSLGIVPCNL